MRDGDDVDPFFAEHAEDPASDADRSAHAFADGGDDGDVVVRRDVFDLMVFDIGCERAPERFECPLGILGWDDEADVVL
ncbi:hypothetical protein OFC56_34955, partial [Escherichia coli]|nr:hypothetical protein [Escherichia coli]